MQHLRACRKGHDQAASSDAASAAAAAAAAACSTCMVASGRRCSAWSPASFVRQQQHIVCSRRTRVDCSEQNALDAFRHAAGYWCRPPKELSLFRVGSRDNMHVLSCTTALLRYMYLRYQTRRKQPAVLLSALEASSNDSSVKFNSRL